MNPSRLTVALCFAALTGCSPDKAGDATCQPSLSSDLDHTHSFAGELGRDQPAQVRSRRALRLDGADCHVWAPPVSLWAHSGTTGALNGPKTDDLSEYLTRVLIVDDSAFTRDGLEALDRIIELTPDVITLDLMMPNLDGVGVLKALAGKPGPRAVVVSTSDADSGLCLAALEAGAFDVVHKPTGLATSQTTPPQRELHF